MSEEVLNVKNLKTEFFTYGGVVKALDNVSFVLKKNETLGLVGETGCGKSVTALSILRLIPSPGKIVGGKVVFKGQNLLEKTEEEMRRIRGKEISMIFQDPTRSLNPVLTVGFQVAEPLIHHQSLKKDVAFEAANKLLYNLDISNPKERLRNYPHELSGGMKQRIMIALALACRPNMIIADEPTTNLDVTIQAQIMELMKDMQREYQTSLLWITHNLGVVAEMCDRVAVMYAGNIVEIGDVKKILLEPLHPYTQSLRKCIPKSSEDKGKLAIIPGTVPNLINPPSGCRFHPRCPNALEICKKTKPEVVELGSGHNISCLNYRDEE
jgi:oligopeptide/dipeptide ABC transporter ATP-binding protein